MSKAFQDSGHAFQGTGLFAFQVDTGAVVPTVTPSVGHVGRPRRKRYLIEGRLLLLTDEELRAYLVRLLRRKKAEQEAAPEPAQPKRAPQPPPAAEPIAPAEFGLLSPDRRAKPFLRVATALADEKWARSQPAILRALHDLALGLETDALRAAEEDDLEVLLLLD